MHTSVLVKVTYNSAFSCLPHCLLALHGMVWESLYDERYSPPELFHDITKYTLFHKSATITWPHVISTCKTFAMSNFNFRKTSQVALENSATWSCFDCWRPDHDVTIASTGEHFYQWDRWTESRQVFKPMTRYNAMTTSSLIGSKSSGVQARACRLGTEIVWESYREVLLTKTLIIQTNQDHPLTIVSSICWWRSKKLGR